MHTVKRKRAPHACSIYIKTNTFAPLRYALCAIYVIRTPLRQGARNRFKSKAYTAKRKNRGHHTGVLYFLEVQAGFEPADNGVADRGLTTWLRHQKVGADYGARDSQSYLRAFRSSL